MARFILPKDSVNYWAQENTPPLTREEFAENGGLAARAAANIKAATKHALGHHEHDNYNPQIADSLIAKNDPEILAILKAAAIKAFPNKKQEINLVTKGGALAKYVHPKQNPELKKAIMRSKSYIAGVSASGGGGDIRKKAIQSIKDNISKIFQYAVIALCFALSFDSIMHAIDSIGEKIGNLISGGSNFTSEMVHSIDAAIEAGKEALETGVQAAEVMHGIEAADTTVRNVAGALGKA